MTEQERRRLIEEAESWLGTPYWYGASLKSIGVDCSHLVVAVLQEVGYLRGVVIPSLPPDWHLHARRELLLEGLRQHCDEVREPWQVGDILVYRKHGAMANHCGLYVGDGRFVHAASGGPVRYEKVSRFPSRHRFVAAFRVRGADKEPAGGALQEAGDVVLYGRREVVV